MPKVFLGNRHKRTFFLIYPLALLWQRGCPKTEFAGAYRAREDDREALDVTWSALEDFTSDENAIVVADGSGSMYWGGDRYRVIRAG